MRVLRVIGAVALVAFAAASIAAMCFLYDVAQGVVRLLAIFAQGASL